MTTTKTESITILLNSTIETMNNVLPISLSTGNPSKGLPELQNESLVVKIGFSDDINGQLVFSGLKSFFQSLGKQMYQMDLPDEMLQSFAGEIGNIISGNIATLLAEKDINTDITTPQVDERLKSDHHLNAIHVPLSSHIGDANLILMTN